MEYIKNYLEDLKKDLDKIDVEEVKKVVDILFDAWKQGKQVFILGNGGSASLASHLACDLGKQTLERVYDIHQKRFRVMSLTDNVSLLTAYGNDLSYDDIFSQQLNNLVNEGDVVIAITGSGNSPNIIKAIQLAKHFRAYTVGLIGFEGGVLKDMVDHAIIFRGKDYGLIEDGHLILHHMITSYLTKKIKEYHENLS